MGDVGLGKATPVLHAMEGQRVSQPRHLALCLALPFIVQVPLGKLLKLRI